MKSVILVASSFLLASAGFAQGGTSSGSDRRPSSQSGQTSGGAPVNEDDRIVCRRIQADTGSMIGGNRRVCMTKREWREYERNN